MDVSIVVRRRGQGKKWSWLDDGTNKDVFPSVSQLLTKLAQGRKKAVLYFSTKDFSGASKLKFAGSGSDSDVDHAIYKVKGKEIDICRDWLSWNFGSIRKVIYAKIMWL